MNVFEVQDKNLDNFLLLTVSVIISVFGTMVNNRFSANRVHNITKLFNEALGRANSAYAFFFLTLSLYSNTSLLGSRIFQTCFVLALATWFGSLFVAEHIIINKLEKLHDCQIDENDTHLCKVEMNYYDVFKVSFWNILIFVLMLILALAASFSKWACGQPCLSESKTL